MNAKSIGIMLVMALALATALVVPAGGQDVTATRSPTPVPTSTPTAITKSKPVIVTVSQYRYIARAVYRHHQVDGDFHARPAITSHMKKRLVRMKSHARNRRALYRMRKITETQRQHWRWYRKIDLATPFGKWAIPSAIVYCESHGERNAYNSSGASGWYQLLGHGAPYPVNTVYAMAANHLIARALYVSSSYYPWISSRPCWG